MRDLFHAASTSSNPVEADVSRGLSAIDWNFNGSTTPTGSVHALHWYPGNFIPQIPNFLIQLLSKPGDLVADTFCGSGTTGVEAVRLGRRAALSDLNRLAVSVASAKLISVTDPLVVSSLSQWLKGSNLLALPQAGNESPPAFRNQTLEDWLHPETYRQLNLLANRIGECNQNSLRQVLELVFSDVLFTCLSTGLSKTSTGKNRRHHWGWVADNVRPKELQVHQAIELFLDRLLVADLTAKSDFIESPLDYSVSQADARKVPFSSNSVDMIVTSPPYVGMIDYTKAGHVEYAWRGWEILKERNDEIGARFRRKQLRGLELYTEAMSLAFAEMSRILKPGGYCAIVIGSSRAYPSAAHEAIARAATLMPIFWGPFTRRPTRRRVSDREGRDFQEHLVVLRKAT